MHGFHVRINNLKVQASEQQQFEEDKESLVAKLTKKSDYDEPKYIGGMTRPIIKRLGPPMNAQ